MKFCMNLLPASSTVKMEAIGSSATLVNHLKHTAVCETAGLAKSVDTQPAVRRLRHRCLLLVILAFCQ